MTPIIFYKDKAIRGIGVPQGILVPRDPESLAVVASDDFTDTNGTLITAHTPTGGGTWALRATGSGAGNASIDNNQVHNTNTASAHFYYHSLVPATPDYAVESDVMLRSDNDLSQVGVMGRIDTAANTQYLFLYRSSVNAWRLFKYVAGAATQLGSSVIQVLTVDQRYRAKLVMVGPTISAYVDGVLAVSVTDAAITAAGKPGIYLQDVATASTGLHLDSWRVLA